MAKYTTSRGGGPLSTFVRGRMISYWWMGLAYRVGQWYVGEIVDSANRIARDREAKGYQPYAGGPLFHEYC